jgi:hypothetical protein
LSKDFATLKPLNLFALKIFNRSLFVFLLTFFSLSLFGQASNYSLVAKVTDKASLEPLQGVSISLFKNDKLVAGTATDAAGGFQIKNLVSGEYLLQFSFIGYKIKKMPLVIGSENKILGLVLLETDNNKLKEVTIDGKQIRVEQKGDTTSINASAYKVNQDATAEDLVKKMPGITVENGTVKAQGEDLKKVLVDGKEFFGDDAQMALRNLPAEVVDKVQIFDRMNDQAQFTGFRDGNTEKTMNITTRNGKNQGTFGKAYAGYGTDNRYQAGITMNYFKANRRITLLGISNNINQQNFSMQDLFGSGAGRMGAMMSNRGSGRSPGMPPMGGAGEFFVGQQAGIATTNSIGLNYTDKWRSKTNVQGSYFFNNSNTYTEKVVNRNFLVNPEVKQLYLDSTGSDNNNFNHRFNLRLEYVIDSMNSFVFTPKLNLQNAILFSDQYAQNFIQDTFLNSTQTTNNTENLGYNLGGNLLYRHRFLKPGRTISLNLGTDINRRNTELYQRSFNRYLDSVANIQNRSFKQFAETVTNGNSYNANLTFTEMLSKNIQLQLSYNPTYTLNFSDRLTSKFDSTLLEYSTIDTTLSNTFDNTVTTHKGNISFNYIKEMLSVTVGVTQQILSLQSVQSFPINDNFRKDFSNLLPNLTIQYKINQAKSLRLIYRTNTNTPSVNQLQNVIDNSNPLLLSAGNPNLSQEYSHTGIIRFGSNNWQSAQSFFAFAMATFTQNYLANANYTAAQSDLFINGVFVPRGAQLSLPTNLNGYINSRSFITYGIPIKKVKSNLNLNLGVNYTKVPGLVNGEKNSANTFNVNSGFIIGSNISERIDFSIGHNANINLVENTLIANQNSNFFINATTLKANLMPTKKWVFSTDLSYTNYQGLGSSFNQDFLLWNAGLGYKFFKNVAEVRLTVFDILSQNTSINRTVTETYIEDNRSNVLQRYFMLTFTYNIRRFNAEAAKENNISPSGPVGPPGRP